MDPRLGTAALLLLAGCSLFRPPPPAPAAKTRSQAEVLAGAFEAARAVLAERFELASADPATGELRAFHPISRFRNDPRLAVRVLIQAKTDGGADVEVRSESLQAQRETLFLNDPDTASTRFSQGREDPVVEREIRDLILARLGGPAGLRP